MKNHYIPKLMLRSFAENERVNYFSMCTNDYSVKKLRDVFSEVDIFDEELEKKIAHKVEGPFGDLLNHKLNAQGEIRINRKENLLMRKFLLINLLRTPYESCSFDEVMDITDQNEHPSILRHRYLYDNNEVYRNYYDKCAHSAETYIPNLVQVAEADDISTIASAPEGRYNGHLVNHARLAHCVPIAFWDTTDSGMEFILPKLQGINDSDNVSPLHKTMVLLDILRNNISPVLKMELERIIWGTAIYCENYCVYPLTPTRALVYFSPYFRGFFPVYDYTGKRVSARPLIDMEHFDTHFYYPHRPELFTPCEAIMNREYKYTVRQLTKEEIMRINAGMLNMETDSFVFHDIDKIRPSFDYYDNKIRFADKKRHSFVRYE